MLLRILTIVISLQVAVEALAQEVRFHNISLRSAIQRAAIEDKLIFVDNYAAYCKPCKRLDIEFKDHKLATYLNKHFINVKVDIESEFGNDFKNTYQVVFLPTIMILDKYGNLKLKIDRLASANELLALSKHYKEKLYPTTINPVASPQNDLSSIQNKKVIKSNSTATTNKYTKIVKQSSDSNKLIANKLHHSNEVIVHVMGQGDMETAPAILRQEAYFRMELMDGSHLKKAHEYLATQKDWSTAENMRFLYDFIYTVNSEEFEYLIKNKEAFEELIGKEQILATINITVNKELERAYPRPDLQKAKVLYSYLNLENPSMYATEYNLSNLLDENKTDIYIERAEEYINNYEVYNADIYYTLSNIYLSSAISNKDYKKIRPLIKKAIALQPNNSHYWLLESVIEYRSKNINEAYSLANHALKVAKSEGQSILEINAMIELLDSQ